MLVFLISPKLTRVTCDRRTRDQDGRLYFSLSAILVGLLYLVTLLRPVRYTDKSDLGKALAWIRADLNGPPYVYNFRYMVALCLACFLRWY